MEISSNKWSSYSIMKSYDYILKVMLGDKYHDFMNDCISTLYIRAATKTYNKLNHSYNTVTKTFALPDSSLKLKIVAHVDNSDKDCSVLNYITVSILGLGGNTKYSLQQTVKQAVSSVVEKGLGLR